MKPLITSLALCLVFTGSCDRDTELDLPLEDTGTGFAAADTSSDGDSDSESDSSTDAATD